MYIQLRRLESWHMARRLSGQGIGVTNRAHVTRSRHGQSRAESSRATSVRAPPDGWIIEKPGLPKQSRIVGISRRFVHRLRIRPHMGALRGDPIDLNLLPLVSLVLAFLSSSAWFIYSGRMQKGGWTRIRGVHGSSVNCSWQPANAKLTRTTRSHLSHGTGTRKKKGDASSRTSLETPRSSP